VTRGEYHNARGDRKRATDRIYIYTCTRRLQIYITAVMSSWVVGCTDRARTRGDINPPCARKHDDDDDDDDPYIYIYIRVIYLFSLSCKNFRNVLRGLIPFKSWCFSRADGIIRAEEGGHVVFPCAARTHRVQTYLRIFINMYAYTALRRQKTFKKNKTKHCEHICFVSPPPHSLPPQKNIVLFILLKYPAEGRPVKS